MDSKEPGRTTHDGPAGDGAGTRRRGGAWGTSLELRGRGAGTDLDAWGIEWLKDQATRNAPQQVLDAGRSLDRWRLFLEGRGLTWIRDVTAADVASFRTWRQSHGTRKATVSIATINRDHATFKAFLNWCVMTDRLVVNVAAKVKLAREFHGTRQIQIVEEGPFEAMWKLLPERWAQAVVALLSTGMRWSSLAKLRPEDIEEARRTVRLVKPKGKRAIELKVTSDRAWSSLKWCAAHGHYGRDVKGLNEAMRTACELAKVPRVTAHMLRHTFAVRPIRAGANAREVQQWLGHADLKTTEIYLRFAAPTAPRVLV